MTIDLMTNMNLLLRENNNFFSTLSLLNWTNHILLKFCQAKRARHIIWLKKIAVTTAPIRWCHATSKQYKSDLSIVTTKKIYFVSFQRNKIFNLYSRTHTHKRKHKESVDIEKAGPSRRVKIRCSFFEPFHFIIILVWC